MMLAAKERSRNVKLGLKLTAAVGLDRLSEAPEAARHSKLQESLPIHCQEAETQQYVGFTTEDVYGGEGEDGSKVDRVHLDHLACWLSDGAPERLSTPALQCLAARG